MHDEIANLLQAALARGGDIHSLSDVVAAIDEGRARLWRRPRAVLVTQVQDYPNVRELHFWLGAGEMAAVLGLVDEVMEWGRSIGCHVATMSGRRGWRRVLGRRGWSASRRRGISGLLEMAKVL